MKKMILLLGLLPSLAGMSQSDLPERFRNKVKARADQRIDEGMDKAIDKTEEGITTRKGSKKNSTREGENEVRAEKAEGRKTDTSIRVFTRYDFVPGEKILLAEDFSQDVKGEFPLKWSTDNRGEVVGLSNRPEQWMRMFPGGHFVSPGVKKISENFTLEFDLLMHYKTDDDYPYPNIYLKLLELKPVANAVKSYLFDQAPEKEVMLNMGPATEDRSYIYLTSSVNNTESFSSPEKRLPGLSGHFGKPIHFAVWVQKQRLRLWINDEKVYDIPQVVPAGVLFNHLAFHVASSSYEEDQLGIYVSNIKLAEGSPDMRSKLITEGRFSTTGIQFDVNSALIKPESSGVLASIARVLEENPGLKIRIVGHTDSDGDAAANMELSKRRALAVKTALSSQYKITGDRMETDGMGESKPVADNTSREGKSQNRRVEFIRL